MFDFEELPGGGSPQAPKPDAPNAKYRPGMVVESVGAAIVRESEDLESPQVCRLLPNSRVEVLDIGVGPTGKRIHIRALEGGSEEGWVSVIAQNAAPLWREVAAAAGAEPPPASTQEAAEKRRKEQEREAKRAADEEAAKQRRREEESRRAAEEEASRKRRAEEEERRRAESERPADRFSVGDIWKCTSSLCMRSEEDLSKPDNEVVGRIDAGSEVEVLEVGAGASGKRIRIRCDAAELEGWVSVVNAEGKQLLSPLRTRADLFVGTGQALGGGEAAVAADPRAAALAAAERRQKGALAHGLGEKKAKELGEQGKRDALLKKIGEIYAKRQEEVPLAVPSASLEALQRHLEQLQSAPPPEASPKASAARASQPAAASAEPVRAAARAAPAKASPPAPAPGRFEPPPRGGQPPLQQPAAAQAQMPQSPPSPEEQRRLLMEEARTVCGLNDQQMKAVEELEALGFEYRASLEAFLACERNKELAANYLFENPLAAEAAAQQSDRTFVTKTLPPAFPGKPPREEDLRLSMDDMEAIQRIQELGFDRPTSLKAYVACKMDEEAAANRLLM